MGMNQAWQVISQPEHVSNQGDPLANEMTEHLFCQMVMTLKRYRYAPDDFPTRASGAAAAVSLTDRDYRQPAFSPDPRLLCVVFASTQPTDNQ